jgi:uncharacterized delta-60 repeat protein
MATTVLAAGLALLGPWSATAASVPMKLDSSFGTNGRVVTDVGGSFYEDEPFSLLMKPDGKFLTAGKAHNRATGNFDFALMQYTRNGSLDPSFDHDGIVLTDFVGAYEEALGIVVQPDGKLVAAGFAQVPGNNYDFALARYNPDGSLDSSFGNGGRVTTDFFGSIDQALALLLQPDGKLVAVGFATNPSTLYDFALARYNADGSLDPSFGNGGRVTKDFFGSIDAAYRALLQPDGKIVAVGTAFNTFNNSYDYAMARYNPNGSLDTGFSTFGTPGLSTTDFFGGTDYAFAVLLQPDGKLLVGGLAFSTVTGHNDFALARYNPDGTRDTTFATYGTPGLATTDFFGNYDQILALALQPDGKILAAGHAKHPTRHFEFALARYNPDGTLDSSFGYAGRLTMDFFGGPDGIHGLVLQADGRAVVAGDAYNPNTGGDDFALVRFLVADPDWVAAVVAGLPDSAFATSSSKAAILSQLDQIKADMTAGRISDALLKLQNLRSRANGCPPAPDDDDWIVTCTGQVQVRPLVEQIIYKLGGR